MEPLSRFAAARRHPQPHPPRHQWPRHSHSRSWPSRPRGRPAVLLLHGYPELAWSWRKVMPAHAAAGYHVIAPDHRGYGRTSGTTTDYDADISGFRFMNLLRDEIGVLYALGHRTVEAVVGHDFGAAVASFLALVRPDIFKRMVLMSRAVRRHRRGAVRHRRPSTRRAQGPDIPCRARRPAADRASITNGISRRVRPTRTSGTPSRASTISCAPTITQERRLERQQALRAQGLDGGRARQDADLLHHGSR